MWGIVPAAGRGSRIQPLAFSKELLPVGSRTLDARQRPCAVSEYLLERLVRGGADKICFVISPGKSDIIEYYGARFESSALVYVVQPEPAGLCDAIFRAGPLIAEHEVVTIGLPDTVWFPADALKTLPEDVLSFLLFPVEDPQFFDAVLTDSEQRVEEIRVKQPQPGSHWIWGAIKMPGTIFHALHRLWLERERGDEYLGTLVNAWLRGGGQALGIRAGTSYVDVGTVHGYRMAMRLLSAASADHGSDAPPGATASAGAPGHDALDRSARATDGRTAQP